METMFYSGGYNSDGGAGLFRFRGDVEGDGLACELEYAGVENPSYLLPHPNGRVLYCVEELNPEGRVCALDMGGGAPVKLAAFPTLGADPCHLALDSTAGFLFVSNYSSGSLSVYRLDSLGSIMEMTDHLQFEGRGVDPEHQACPHAHFAVEHDGRIYVCDLGLDKVLCYTLDRETGRLLETGESFAVPGGSGPRHLCFSPEKPGLMYLICELTAEVFAFERGVSGWRERQRIASIPADFKEYNGAAAIRLSDDGRLLFISNRGYDSITVFDVGSDGSLSLRQQLRDGLDFPRDLAVFGPYILAANQKGGNITAYKLNKETGLYEKLPLTLPAGCPTCIA